MSRRLGEYACTLAGWPVAVLTQSHRREGPAIWGTQRQSGRFCDSSLYTLPTGRSEGRAVIRRSPATVERRDRDERTADATAGRTR